jgi:hypothetical protein
LLPTCLAAGEELIVPPEEPAPPALALGAESDHPVPVVTETGPGVRAEVLLHGSQPSETTVDGIAVDPDGRLLLTMPAGIARVDLRTGRLDWAVPIPVAGAMRWRWRTIVPEPESRRVGGRHPG